jgi:hypothetical protein
VTAGFFPAGPKPHASLPIPLWESCTRLAENKIRKLQQEVLDSVVDNFGSNVQTVGLDEYIVDMANNSMPVT